MNKRTDAIRSMFSGAPPLSGDNTPMVRVPSGSVRSMRDTFSEVERENETLRATLATGAGAIEVDPSLIDPSPHADRFEGSDPESFETLKASIAEKGQLIPVLLRRSPDDGARFQSAFGHRRIRAARALGIKVKAYIRELSDEALVMAQGLENSARENLSFIERAVFAQRLEQGGFGRPVIQSALSVDKAEASKLIAVASAVPATLIRAIGAAPRVGRPRWQALAAALGGKPAQGRATAAVEADGFRHRSSDDRFALVLAAATAKPHAPAKQSREGALTSVEGREIARFSLKERSLKLTMQEPDFAAFVVDKIPELFEAFAGGGSGVNR